jgi:hypothetical protein
METQTAIVRELDKKLAECETLSNAITAHASNIAKYPSALLRQAFRGEL